MTEHDLKCWPEFYEALLVNRKCFELRKDDRNFQVGDVMWLREWDPGTKQYTGREMRREITYKLAHQPGAGYAADFGLKEGYAVLSIV